MKGKWSALCIAALAALYYFCGLRVFAAFILSVTVHELGHIAALLAFGGKLKRIGIEAGGFNIEAAGIVTSAGEVITVLAGCASGFVFSLLCRIATQYDFMLEAGRISTLLSAYNLLPALPLDGGRIAERILLRKISCIAAERLLKAFGIICGIAVSIAGAIFGYAVAIGGGVWLIIAQTGIVKRDGVL